MNSIPNELAARFAEVDIRKQIMKEYGNSESAFLGHNEDGELVEMSVHPDEIIVKTYQENGWLRVNYYDENGLPNGETFEGKWEDESERMQQAEPEELHEVYTVAIVNIWRPEAEAWISNFTTEARAERFRAKVLEWIQAHGCSDFLRVDADSMTLDSEEYLDLLEETYGTN